VTWPQLANKRLLSYLSWQLGRRRSHLEIVLNALVRDLHEVAPDHIAITGDVVNLALPAEFAEAGTWLRRLGPPDWISLVPGNHDALVSVLPRDGWDRWRAYATSDPEPEGACDAGFPFLRRRGALAIIGLSTALPTGLGLATGRLGTEQLARLDVLLERLEAEHCYRVVLAHHSPIDGLSRRRRRLIDAARLRHCIAERGAELILHGHEHAFSFGQVAGPDGPVPVFGSPSASRFSAQPDLMAQYQVYEIDHSAGAWRIVAESRTYSPASESFVQSARRVVLQQNGALILHAESVFAACRRSA
jgi:3',5'-cyclic AMP phosphodiesterase CpdA